MRLAPGAWTWCAPFLVGAALAATARAWALAVVFALLALGVLAFHRDPERRIGEGMVAPSDGRVAEVSTGPAGTFLGVFLNVHDVHVIRAPHDATVLEVRRFRGPRAPAWSKRARHNAGVELRLASAAGETRLRMLTGVVARRVVPFVAEGQTLRKGERVGLIRFGSRVELVLPPRTTAGVRPGQRLVGGVTTVAVPAPGARPTEGLKSARALEAGT